MSFWKKKDNLIISAFVALFFVGLFVWSDMCCVNASLFSRSPNPTEVEFINKDQQTLTLGNFKGKPLIVNMWATWCPVCVKKMDSLNTLAGKFQAKGGEVLAISEDRGGLSKVRSYFTRNGYTNLNAYIDPKGELLNALGGRGLPTTIFFDAEGNEVWRVSGGMDWDSRQAEQLIKKYFGIDIS